MPPSERTLIVGIDYSDFCIPALDRAVRMAAEASGTRLVPLLALPYGTTPSTGAEGAIEDFMTRARENLERLVEERCRANGVNKPETVPVVCFGAAATCLLERAEQLTADLILVGTHGRQGLEHLFMGSVAEEVVRRATCSVLVARARASAHTARSEERTPAIVERAKSGYEVSRAAADQPLAAESGQARALGEPYLDAGRVVLNLLDVPSGQVFICSFVDFASVRVEPLEGSWVPQPSSEARARVAWAALEEALREAPRFEELFEERARRATARQKELAED
jgi:nucleotide-binding universal stress UspA family protein